MAINPVSGSGNINGPDFSSKSGDNDASVSTANASKYNSTMADDLATIAKTAPLLESAILNQNTVDVKTYSLLLVNSIGDAMAAGFNYVDQQTAKTGLPISLNCQLGFLRAMVIPSAASSGKGIGIFKSSYISSQGSSPTDKNVLWNPEDFTGITSSGSQNLSNMWEGLIVNGEPGSDDIQALSTFIGNMGVAANMCLSTWPSSWAANPTFNGGGSPAAGMQDAAPHFESIVNIIENYLIPISKSGQTFLLQPILDVLGREIKTTNESVSLTIPDQSPPDKTCAGYKFIQSMNSMYSSLEEISGNQGNSTYYAEITSDITALTVSFDALEIDPI